MYRKTLTSDSLSKHGFFWAKLPITPSSPRAQIGDCETAYLYWLGVLVGCADIDFFERMPKRKGPQVPREISQRRAVEKQRARLETFVANPEVEQDWPLL